MVPANQGSKAALITWTVIATVFGITMAVLALISYVDANDARAQLVTRQTTFNEFASEADLQSAAMSDARAKVKDDGASNVYNLLVSRMDTLARQTTGATTYEQAGAAIESTLQQVNQRNSLNAATLTGAIEQLQARLVAMNRENESLRETQTSLQARLESEQQNGQQMLAQKDEAIRQLQDELAEQQALHATLLERLQVLETDTTQDVEGLRMEWEDKLRVAEDRITQLSRSLESAEERVRILMEQNARRWNFDQMMASPDGAVLRSPSQGILYVNIGRNQGVTNGMTFEVYDPVKGIPKVESANATDLPVGKGSVQIIRVYPDSSEARVVKQQPAQTIREGDLIANLAFDKNVPVRFRVYGDFDLNNDGEPDPNDRDRVITLIREFGGRMVEDVTVETDVLVMGREPEVPRMTEADLMDPEKNRQYQNAIQARDQYLAVRDKALQLNVPILNQNQFLYYIGYWDQVNR